MTTPRESAHGKKFGRQVAALRRPPERLDFGQMERAAALAFGFLLITPCRRCLERRLEKKTPRVSSGPCLMKHGAGMQNQGRLQALAQSLTGRLRILRNRRRPD